MANMTPEELSRAMADEHRRQQEAARDPEKNKVRARSKEFQDVLAFHQRFGLLWFTSPGHVTFEKLRERIEFMQEELTEFTEAAGFSFIQTSLNGNIVPIRTTGHGAPDLAQMADALVDLVYVAVGTAVQLGLPWDWLWDDVQRANMEKVRGVTKRGHAVDVTKPPGWQGPQTQRILDIAGYRKSDWFIDDAFREAHARRDGEPRPQMPQFDNLNFNSLDFDGPDNVGPGGSLT